MSDVMARMAQHEGTFTPNEHLIYDYVERNPDKVAQMTTTSLAEACGVSQPALTRFVKTLGYSRYQDFRADLIAWQARDREGGQGPRDGLPYFDVLHRELDLVEGLLTNDLMRELSDYVGSFRRVFATGVGKSRHPADLLEVLMIKTGRDFRSVGVDVLRELSDSLLDTDLMIVFSVGGNHQSFRFLRNTAGSILAITTDETSELAHMASRTVTVPVAGASAESCSVSPVMFDVFVELLCEYLLLDAERASTKAPGEG